MFVVAHRSLSSALGLNGGAQLSAFVSAALVPAGSSLVLDPPGAVGGTYTCDGSSGSNILTVLCSSPSPPLPPPSPSPPSPPVPASVTLTVVAPAGVALNPVAVSAAWTAAVDTAAGVQARSAACAPDVGTGNVVCTVGTVDADAADRCDLPAGCTKSIEVAARMSMESKHGKVQEL